MEVSAKAGAFFYYSPYCKVLIICLFCIVWLEEALVSYLVFKWLFVSFYFSFLHASGKKSSKRKLRFYLLVIAIIFIEKIEDG